MAGVDSDDNAELPEDYYKVLEVGTNATTEEIKQAFRSKALKTHSDKTGTSDTSAFIAVTEAFNVLRDESERAAYDLKRLQSKAEAIRTAGSASKHTGDRSSGRNMPRQPEGTTANGAQPTYTSRTHNQSYPPKPDIPTHGRAENPAGPALELKYPFSYHSSKVLSKWVAEGSPAEQTLSLSTELAQLREERPVKPSHLNPDGFLRLLVGPERTLWMYDVLGTRFISLSDYKDNKDAKDTTARRNSSYWRYLKVIQLRMYKDFNAAGDQEMPKELVKLLDALSSMHTLDWKCLPYPSSDTSGPNRSYLKEITWRLHLFWDALIGEMIQWLTDGNYDHIATDICSNIRKKMLTSVTADYQRETVRLTVREDEVFWARRNLEIKDMKNHKPRKDKESRFHAEILRKERLASLILLRLRQDRHSDSSEVEMRIKGTFEELITVFEAEAGRYDITKSEDVSPIMADAKLLCFKMLQDFLVKEQKYDFPHIFGHGLFKRYLELLRNLKGVCYDQQNYADTFKPWKHHKDSTSERGQGAKAERCSGSSSGQQGGRSPDRYSSAKAPQTSVPQSAHASRRDIPDQFSHQKKRVNTEGMGLGDTALRGSQQPQSPVAYPPRADIHTSSRKGKPSASPEPVTEQSFNEGDEEGNFRQTKESPKRSTTYAYTNSQASKDSKRESTAALNTERPKHAAPLADEHDNIGKGGEEAHADQAPDDENPPSNKRSTSYSYVNGTRMKESVSGSREIPKTRPPEFHHNPTTDRGHDQGDGDERRDSQYRQKENARSGPRYAHSKSGVYGGPTDQEATRRPPPPAAPRTFQTGERLDPYTQSSGQYAAGITTRQSGLPQASRGWADPQGNNPSPPYSHQEPPHQTLPRSYTAPMAGVPLDSLPPLGQRSKTSHVFRDDLGPEFRAAPVVATDQLPKKDAYRGPPADSGHASYHQNDPSRAPRGPPRPYVSTSQYTHGPVPSRQPPAQYRQWPGRYDSEGGHGYPQGFSNQEQREGGEVPPASGANRYGQQKGGYYR
ncbi:hypothetical protein BJ508DRAFT_333065 [Ascobolus immersus RN42]|uniref:J domain-containing protein n=1 Tax=Ascobolus immersus RN42 TaxID=1160509 RepID=A0A3N4HKT8_ASCIM|nr:hypothetical protein BJ508DRAFT_333065 [Ascobolus immersus RN42]